ncbi:MAG TPA: DUF4258 domain-containing protein [Desulfotomaculum sp.]|nr:DUF4258 domain-containing protein [Desulfotomaculum sp.]
MEIYFSRHAKNRMRRYRIKPEEVLAVIHQPDHEADSIKGRKNAWKKRNSDWLRITFVSDDGGNKTVITVTVKQKFHREEE